MIKQFFKPTSLEEALLIKEKHDNTVTWFAGGAYFNHASYKARFEKVISLEGLGLHAIHSKHDQISVGATVTLQKLGDNNLIPKPLKQAALEAGTRTFRNMATVGGDAATGGNRTALAPCLIALQASVVTAEKEEVPLEAYLHEDRKDLILKIIIPDQQLNACIGQFQVKANAPALVRVASSATRTDSGDLDTLIIAIGSVEASPPRRLKDIESLVSKNPSIDRDSLAQSISRVVEPAEDVLGSSHFKRYIAGITIADCVLRSLEKE